MWRASVRLDIGTLAVGLANTESKATCGDLSAKLKGRSLKGVLPRTSDEHKTLLRDWRGHSLGADLQHCQTRSQRNVRGLVLRSQQTTLAEGLRKVFAAATSDEARTSVNALTET